MNGAIMDVEPSRKRIFRRVPRESNLDRVCGKELVCLLIGAFLLIDWGHCSVGIYESYDGSSQVARLVLVKFKPPFSPS